MSAPEPTPSGESPSSGSPSAKGASGKGASGKGASGKLTVAMIGLGRMGGPMADNVIAAGHDVRVFDVSAAAVGPRVDAGAHAASSVAEAAKGADVVGVVVFDDSQATEVIDGPEGVLSVVAPGAVVCLHTTVTVDTIEHLGALADDKGVHLVDAGVSGGEPGAAAGTLVTMVGGSDEAIDRARPVMEAYSGEVVHAGPRGAGMALKLARNAVGYTMMGAAHEALVLTTAAGIEPTVLRHVLEITDLPAMFYAPFTLGGPEPLPDDAPEQFRAAMEHTSRLGVKDLGQALALAARLGVDTPTTASVRATFPAVMRLDERH